MAYGVQLQLGLYLIYTYL